MEMRKAKAHILYQQVNVAFPWVLRPGDNGQHGARGLGWGQVCVDMRRTSLVHEKHCWILGFARLHGLSPHFLMRTVFGGAALLSLWV